MIPYLHRAIIQLNENEAQTTAKTPRFVSVKYKTGAG
jgi:hypothetical protein